MTILTNKMRTHGNAIATPKYIGTNAKLFFPFDEGSGNTFTDAVQGFSFTQSGATHNTTHAIKTLAVNTNRTDNKTLSLDGNKHLLMFIANIAATGQSAVTNFIIGDVSTFNIKLQNNLIAVDSSAGSTVSITPITTDLQTCFMAVTFNKDTGAIRSYLGINGSTVTFDQTADAVSHKGKLAAMSNTFSFNSGLSQELFCAGVLELSALPSETDLLDMLEVTHTNVLSGKKYYDSRLSNY